MIGGLLTEDVNPGPKRIFVNAEEPTARPASGHHFKPALAAEGEVRRLPQVTNPNAFVGLGDGNTDLSEVVRALIEQVSGDDPASAYERARRQAD